MLLFVDFLYIFQLWDHGPSIHIELHEPIAWNVGRLFQIHKETYPESLVDVATVVIENNYCTAFCYRLCSTINFCYLSSYNICEIFIFPQHSRTCVTYRNSFIHVLGRKYQKLICSSAAFIHGRDSGSMPPAKRAHPKYAFSDKGKRSDNAVWLLIIKLKFTWLRCLILNTHLATQWCIMLDRFLCLSGIYSQSQASLAGISLLGVLYTSARWGLIVEPNL